VIPASTIFARGKTRDVDAPLVPAPDSPEYWADVDAMIESLSSGTSPLETQDVLTTFSHLITQTATNTAPQDGDTDEDSTTDIDV
jgi:hypothetical protein